MNWQLDVVLLPIMVITAMVALRLKDLAASTVIFSAFSFLSCILYASLEAVDVAFTEAMIGAGVSAVVFFAALSHTGRRARE